MRLPLPPPPCGPSPSLLDQPHVSQLPRPANVARRRGPSSAHYGWGARRPLARSSTSLAPYFSLTAQTAEVLRCVHFTTVLSRRGRQCIAEFQLTTLSPDVDETLPVTIFTGGWMARLLGYPHKYRGARVIETFLAAALRSYLLLYDFFPRTLALRGAFCRFTPFWRLVNAPADQVFSHPLTGRLLWDVRLPGPVLATHTLLRERLAELFLDASRGGLEPLDAAVLDLEAHALLRDLRRGALPPRPLLARYTLAWAQVLFLPTRINKPRRPKRARGIRKRLAKRLVRVAGRRFWAS